MQDKYAVLSELANEKSTDHFINLSFVLNGQILDNGVHAIILLLLEEFNKIAKLNIQHNLEIAEHYSLDIESVRWEDCEIVLKYIDCTICVSNGEQINNSLECNISRGLIKFYLREKLDSGVYQYQKIDIVKFQSVDNLDQFMDKVYQNHDEIAKLEDATGIALAKGQSEAICKITNSGHLEVDDAANTKLATQTVSKIINKAKKASTISQFYKMNRNRIISMAPTLNSVNVANLVARAIGQTNHVRNHNLVVVQVPDNEPMPVQTLKNVKYVSGTIKNTGILPHNADGTGQNTLNSKSANSRASIAIDASIVVLPLANAKINNANKIILPISKNLYAITERGLSMPILQNELSNINPNLINTFENKLALCIPVSMENARTAKAIMENGVANMNRIQDSNVAPMINLPKQQN